MNLLRCDYEFNEIWLWILWDIIMNLIGQDYQFNEMQLWI